MSASGKSPRHLIPDDGGGARTRRPGISLLFPDRLVLPLLAFSDELTAERRAEARAEDRADEFRRRADAEWDD
jgi:hypothetical protein